MKILKQLHTQRIKSSFFSDNETLQLKSIERSREITNLIKSSDTKLKELSRAETSEASDEQSKLKIIPDSFFCLFSSKKYAIYFGNKAQGCHP